MLNGEIRIFKWPAARPLLAANRDPVRFELALTEMGHPRRHARRRQRGFVRTAVTPAQPERD